MVAAGREERKAGRHDVAVIRDHTASRDILRPGAGPARPLWGGGITSHNSR